MLCAITGPSGAGKSTLISMATSLLGPGQVTILPTLTTRPARATDLARTHVSVEQIDAMRASGELAEVMQYDGSLYALSAASIKAAASDRSSVALLDYAGEYPSLTAATRLARLRFVILPPSATELESRLVRSHRVDRIVSAIDEYHECLEDQTLGRFAEHGWTVVVNKDLQVAARTITDRIRESLNDVQPSR